ncbi:MAG: hypothetical protein AB4368_17435 [Xenococcaceae cyanobacterium]
MTLNISVILGRKNPEKFSNKVQKKSGIEKIKIFIVIRAKIVVLCKKVRYQNQEFKNCILEKKHRYLAKLASLTRSTKERHQKLEVDSTFLQNAFNLHLLLMLQNKYNQSGSVAKNINTQKDSAINSI